jgi:transposase
MEDDEEEEAAEEAPDINDDEPPNPRRYFNQRLKSVYERVTIPTLAPFQQPPTGMAVHKSQYKRSLHKNGTAKNASPYPGKKPRARWSHSSRTPLVPPPNPLFANRFKALLDMPTDGDGDGGDNGGGDGAPGSSSAPLPNAKRSKGNDGCAKQPPVKRKPAKPARPAKKAVAKPKPVGEEKKTWKPFQRKNPVQGKLVTYKIRMWPNEEQTNELKRMFSISRLVKNWLNSELKANRQIPDPRNPGQTKALWPSRINLNAHFKAHRDEALPEWARQVDVSSTVFNNACFAVADAYQNGIQAVKEGRITHFDVKYWSNTVRTPTEVIGVDKKYRPDGKSAASIFDETTPHTPSKARSGKHSECLLHLNKRFKPLGGIRMQDKTHIIDSLLSEGKMLKENCKIKWDKRARSFHFIYTMDKPVPEDPDPTWESKSVTSFDGGVRGFQTYFNATTGEYGELVCGFKDRILDRLEKIDDLHSKSTRRRQGMGVRTEDKQRRSRRQRRHDTIHADERRRRTTGCMTYCYPACNSQRVTRLNRKLRRDRVRHTNWVEAVHYNAINFILQRTDIVINPVLRTSQITERNGRVFGAASTRSCLTMSHYKFNQRLKWKSVFYPGRHVFDGTGEPGTTRTCPNPNCGRWHVNLGGDHTFTCPACAIVVNRDDNGARGNLLAAYGKAVGILADGTSNVHA